MRQGGRIPKQMACGVWHVACGLCGMCWLGAAACGMWHLALAERGTKGAELLRLPTCPDRRHTHTHTHSHKHTQLRRGMAICKWQMERGRFLVPYLHLINIGARLVKPQQTRQWTKDNGHWTVDNGQWTQHEGRGTAKQMERQHRHTVRSRWRHQCAPLLLLLPPLPHAIQNSLQQMAHPFICLFVFLCPSWLLLLLHRVPFPLYYTRPRRRQGMVN